MLDNDVFRDDPDRVRERLAIQEGNQHLTPGDWYVFETISADGSLAIGVARGVPNPSSAMVVYERLSHPIALQAARGLADWYRNNGRDVDGELPSM